MKEKRQLSRMTRDQITLAFVAIIYFLLANIPGAFLAFSTFQEFTTLKIIVLACLLSISILSATTWLKPQKQKPQA